MTFGLEAQLRFGTEFALFLVAIAGLALTLTRPELLTRVPTYRLALAVGFAALAGGAFVHGSLLVDTDSSVAQIAVGAGWVALLVGAGGWEGGRSSRQLVIAAVGLGLLGTAATAFEEPEGAAALRAVAAIAMGIALVQASRRAVAARVVASSAATLLVVVLILSVGLSSVLSNTIETQAVASLDGRALREASLVEGARANAIQTASVTSLGIIGSDVRDTVLAINEQGSATPEQSASLVKVLDGLGAFFLGETVSLAYADNRAGVVAAADLPVAAFVELLGTRAAEQARQENTAVGDVVVLGDRAVAVGVVPVVTKAPDVPRSLGLVIAAVEVDAAYLETRGRAEDTVQLAIWSRTGPIASFGQQPPVSVVQPIVTRVLEGSDGDTAITEERFVAARSVRSQANRPLLALVVSRPTTAVSDLRENLFITFFVIGFGGALLALLLAAFVGNRIGEGIRKLTASAEALERGESGVRSGLLSEDEVGRLSGAFDAMAASIEEKTDALRQAALEEAALRDRVEAIIAGMGEALVAVDREGLITDFNEAAEDLIGAPGEATKGRLVTDVVHLRTEEGGSLSERLLEADRARWSELGELDADGEVVPVAVTAGPLRGAGGEVEGRVIVLRDLRGEREVERMKREFLSRVGHELRTPLTPLLGYARILAGRAVSAQRARDIAASMVSSAQRLERIVEMLEFFASAQAGRTVLRPEVIDLRDLLTTVVEERRASCPNGHVLVRRVRTRTPRVLGDPYWLRRSIDELLDNAIKFSPDGGRIAVTAGPTDSFVEIAVSDPGVGMTPDELERAFAEWSQGDESDTRAYGGLGLGLALVRRVVERHGGRITCDTAPGRGSKFSILLPALPTQEGDASRARPRAARDRRDPGGVREDDRAPGR